MIALRRAVVRAQEVQGRAVGQHDWVALQIEVCSLSGELDDVLFEDMRLRLGR
ncbi:hypothetical protein D3C71_2021930 [compost metagenome]